jgi:predicted phosphodiesterase
MIILVISDIHANLAAFETVLKDADSEWEKIWCLGDLVGYGPYPNECVALLREHDHLSLSGNHDWAVLGRLDPQTFNADAQYAISWTQKAISETTRTYLEALPPTLVHDSYTLSHGSPRQPVWEYILDERTAAVNFSYFDTPICLVGHTHVPVMYEQTGDASALAKAPRYGEQVSLKGSRQIINPGSVGQPRDSDPRAAYALLDTESWIWEHRRVSYPVEDTQEQMRDAGMPYRLVARLEYGW